MNRGLVIIRCQHGRVTLFPFRVRPLFSSRPNLFKLSPSNVHSLISCYAVVAVTEHFQHFMFFYNCYVGEDKINRNAIFLPFGKTIVSYKCCSSFDLIFKNYLLFKFQALFLILSFIFIYQYELHSKATSAATSRFPLPSLRSLKFFR